MNNNIKKFKTKKRTNNLFLEQINKFTKIKDNCSHNNKYNINDDVVLSPNHLIHGTRISIDGLNQIRENGLLAPEFISYKKNKQKKKTFVVEFWDITEEISLKDYINKYCGVTIEVSYPNQNISRIITPIGNIETEILKLKDYRDYKIFQNQEQRFLPNNYNNNATMAFIIKENDSNKELLKNDIFSTCFDKKILKDILPKWFYKKYLITRNFDVYETGREKAIIYGIPSCFIEGILVNNEIEKDKEKLDKIKEIFPNCYICNIEGKVID